MIGFTRRRHASPIELGTRSFGLTGKLHNADLAVLFSELRMLALARSETNPNHRHTMAAAILSAAMQTTIGIQPYEVQHHAALVMALGGVAEMSTGEGKTIAVAIAAAVIAASGQSVHVATSNEYLAKRDFAQMKLAFSRLGLQVGLIDRNPERSENRLAYQCDITYGTADGFAFDYLRDVVLRRERGSRPLGRRETQTERLSACPRRHAIVIDEIDHCLIDEAMTPLVLSTPMETVSPNDQTATQTAATMAMQLVQGTHWIIDETTMRSRLTQEGTSRAIAVAPHCRLTRPWTEYVSRAIDANHLLRLEVDYVVRNGEIVIIDRATGRLADGRQWQNGLYQAVQQKESIAIAAEPTMAAQITHAKFLSLYHHVCGCSGTAWNCRHELNDVYHVSTTLIEPRLTLRRTVQTPRFHASAKEKWQAILEEICEVHVTGRPVLVGTRTINESKLIASSLAKQNIISRVLNGIQDEDEALVISQAGQHGAITVATDMAGRGTDILLSEEVISLGGLHVIVTEPRHSSRLDRQLIGRCARQGQPGTSRTFVAADDALLLQFGRGLSRYLARQTATNLSRINSDTRATASLWKAVLKAARKSESKAAAERATLVQRDQRRQDFISSTNHSRESLR